MARPTRFIAACQQIEAAIESATREGKGARSTRLAMQRDLAMWACTQWAGAEFPRLASLRLPWKRWDMELYGAGIRVAAALRLIALDNLRVAKAARDVRAPEADVRKALALLSDATLSLHDVVRAQHPDVVTALTGARERIRVNLEQRALEDMLLAAAEGYQVSPGKGYRYTEVFGVCFGSVRRKPRSYAQDLFVNVGRVATQMRAKATASEVLPNSKSLAAQLEIGEQFFPHLEAVGDYHTHPYRSLADLRVSSGWRYSDADERAVQWHVDEVRAHNHAQPLFSLVVAVARGGKKGKGSRRRAPNIVQLAVGNLFFVIGAYRIRLDATYDDEIELSLAAYLE